MLRTKELNAQRAIGRLKYEVETTTIEIGRLQTRLLQSVPTEEYDKLMRKYKRLIKETTGVETNNEEVMARQEMTVYAKSPVEAELEARENMLKVCNLPTALFLNFGMIQGKCFRQTSILSS